MPKALPVIDMSAPVCCAPVAAGPVDDAAALEVALRLKALADPVRVKFDPVRVKSMSLLLASPDTGENGGDLAVAVGLAESTVSHHLGRLRKAGLVESGRVGMNVVQHAKRDALAVVSITAPVTAAEPAFACSPFPPSTSGRKLCGRADPNMLRLHPK